MKFTWEKLDFSKPVVTDIYLFQVHFRNFSLENHPDCRFDFVEILNGGLPTSPSLGHFCGNSTPADFVSQSNAIRLIFNSDESVANNGFLLEYWQSAGGKTFYSKESRVIFLRVVNVQNS